MKILAIVPARCGSKGIPHKNVTPCAGLPLIQWTYDAIDQSSLITDTCVTTDCEHIHPYGSDNYHMIEQPISDDAQIEDRLGHIIEDYDADIVVLLQPTSPVRTGKQIDEAITQLQREGADSLVSVVPSHSFLWSKIVEVGGRIFQADSPVSNYNSQVRPCRQNLPPQYEENGSIYVFTRDHWDGSLNRVGGKVSLYVMPEECRQQVDTPFDLWLVEQILVRQHSLITGNAL
jgi:CMP-N,N'-diacetyllegionaminic acid synthase